MIAKSEDLPGMKLLSYELLAESMRFRPGMSEQMFLACAFQRGLFRFSGREYGSVSFPCTYSPMDTERNAP